MAFDIEQFYRENYSSYVKRIARKAGGLENAEDIIQEAFYRALKYKDTFNLENKTDVEVWFNTIVRRALYDFKRIELKQGMTSAIDSGETEAVERDGVDQVTADEILKILEEKPNIEHRQVLYLALVRQYPPRDISQVLDMNTNTIKSIVDRFKTEMAERYGYDRKTAKLS